MANLAIEPDPYGEWFNTPKGFGANPTPATPAPVSSTAPSGKILPNTPAAAADVAAMTRAARVAKYGEAAVAAMEKAGSTFGGTAPVASAAMDATPAWARALPTVAAGWGALKTAAGIAAPAIMPAVEATRVADSAMDPNQSAGETGLRAGMGAGRLAGMKLGSMVPGPWWAKAIGATAGYMAPDAAESISRWAQGGSDSAAPTPAPATPAPVVAPTYNGPQWGEPGHEEAGRAWLQKSNPRLYAAMMARNGGTAGPGALPTFPAQPGELELGQRNLAAARSRTMSAADVNGTMIPDPGTGAMVTPRGVIRLTSASTPDAADMEANAMHARGQAVYGVGNGFGARAPSSASTIAAGFGAIMNQRHEAGISARQFAQHKLDAELAGKKDAAAHSRAQADLIRSNAAAADRMEAAGEPAASVAAVRNGHAPPQARYVFPVNMQPLPGSKEESLGGVAADSTTGEFKRVRIKEPPKAIRLADVIAKDKADKRYVSDVQSRKNAESYGYKVTE